MQLLQIKVCKKCKCFSSARGTLTQRKTKKENQWKMESYFKRVKKPVSSAEEAKPLIKETLIYFLICGAVFVLFAILSAVVPSVKTVFLILGVIAFLPTAYFAIMLYAMKRVTKRLKNLTCTCGEKYNYDSSTWKEVSRRWSTSSDTKKAEGKLYVTVQITGRCPKCGKQKTFEEELCSGKITVTDYSTRDSIVSTESLVRDYFAGVIHA